MSTQIIREIYDKIDKVAYEDSKEEQLIIGDSIIKITPQQYENDGWAEKNSDNICIEIKLCFIKFEQLRCCFDYMGKHDYNYMNANKIDLNLIDDGQIQTYDNAWESSSISVVKINNIYYLKYINKCVSVIEDDNPMVIRDIILLFAEFVINKPTSGMIYNTRRELDEILPIADIANIICDYL